MPQASLAMFAMTSCVQCTIHSLVLNAPTHLQKSLESVGFIATPRCARPVKLSTGYFQKIPRDFPVRILAIAFWATPPTLLRCRSAKLSGASSKIKSQGISRKKSVGSLGNIPRPTSRLQCRQRLLLAQVTVALFPYAPCLLSVVSCPCHQRKQPWNYSEGNMCYCSVTNILALIPSFFSPCREM